MNRSVIPDTAQRAQLAGDLVAALQAGMPGSRALLRGSLAEGRADHYSDIDLLWEVPDADFARAIARTLAICEGVRPVASLRVDPDFQRSAKRRLVFVRFTDVPLFWRVDLDIFARSVGRDPDYDRDNPAARGSEWSATESSLAIAVAALKASLRGRDDEAIRLLILAERRVEVPGPDIDVRVRIRALSEAIVQIDPEMASLAASVRHLVAAL
jgi:predicted nucleotidyltransferase